MFRGVLCPAAGILLAAAALGLASNALRERGRLELGRAYFGTGGLVGPRMPALTRPVPGESAVARRAREEFRVLDGGEAAALFDASQREPGTVVFIDARDDAHFVDGHVPGALQLDYYDLHADIRPVEPLLRRISWLVVYCESSDCEDGLLLCRALRDEFRVRSDRILLHVGGMREWAELGLPIDRGGGL